METKVAKKTAEERLKDIKEHPERHKHGDLNGIIACSIVDGAIDSMLFEAHSQYASCGYNGGQSCDVTRGPCSCGAWH